MPKFAYQDFLDDGRLKNTTKEFNKFELNYENNSVNRRNFLIRDEF
ncbi:hypothetical protein V7008_15995 [Neobacillus drentensis]